MVLLLATQSQDVYFIFALVCIFICLLIGAFIVQWRNHRHYMRHMLPQMRIGDIVRVDADTYVGYCTKVVRFDDKLLVLTQEKDFDSIDLNDDASLEKIVVVPMKELSRNVSYDQRRELARRRSKLSQVQP